MSSPPPKVLLVANTSWYLYNFRRPLARALKDRGARVVLVSPRDDYSQRLIDEGFEWRDLWIPRSRPHPVRELKSLADFVRIYRQEAPDAVHHFTIRCVVYGSMAAAVAGVRARINAVTGLGHVFLSNTLKTRLFRPPLKLLLRWSLGSGRSIFQNPDDLRFYEDSGLVNRDRTLLIRGSGVDIRAFNPDHAPRTEIGPLRVLFAGRLLREKGVFELIEAIRALKNDAKTRSIAFTIAGEPYPGNPSSVTEEQLADWKREGLADFPGHVDPILPWLSKSDVVILPSYREGTPKILLEACAMQRPVIATDVPGCREVVDHERNGLLVPVRDAQALAQAVARLADSTELREKYGQAGRRKMIEEFSDTEVARKTLEAYEAQGVLKREDARRSERRA